MLIQEEDVSPLICREIPAVDLRQSLLANASSVFRQVNCLADYTRSLIETGQLHKIRNCFHVADRMLQQGCATVKIAVENVFMFTIGSLLDQSPAERETVKRQLTPGLLDVYKRQLIANGI